MKSLPRWTEEGPFDIVQVSITRAEGNRPKMTHLKLFGLMRTCTNLAAWMMEENFREVRVWHNRGAWKHGRPLDTGDDGYLICVKNPLAWVDSMMRYRPAPLPALVESWNSGNRAYLAFLEAKPAAHLVRHEDLLVDYDQVLDGLGGALSLECLNSSYRRQDRAMWRGGDDMRGAATSGEFDISYYTERRYLPTLGKDARALIRDLASPEVCESLGYDLTEYAP